MLPPDVPHHFFMYSSFFKKTKKSFLRKNLKRDEIIRVTTQFLQ